MHRIPSRLRWKRVLLAAAVLVTLGASVVLHPACDAHRTLARERRLQQAYAGGLQPCGGSGSGGGDFERAVQTAVPGPPDLSLEEHPTLVLHPRLIQIVAERVYLLEFDALHWQTDRASGGPRLHVDAAPRILSAPLSSHTRDVLRSLFAGDIRHAQAADSATLDGVAYVARVPGVGCAYANSPALESRAGKVMHLFSLLVLHARLTQSDALDRSEAEIRAWAEALQLRE